MKEIVLLAARSIARGCDQKRLGGGDAVITNAAEYEKAHSDLRILERRIGDAAEFLGLSAEEEQLVEVRLATAIGYQLPPARAGA